MSIAAAGVRHPRSNNWDIGMDPEGCPRPGKRYVIADSGRSVVAEIGFAEAGMVPRSGRAVIRLQLKPEVRVRTDPERGLVFVKPRDLTGRTVEEAMELGWLDVVKPKRRKPERLLTPEQADAVHRIFQRRMRPAADL